MSETKFTPGPLILQPMSELDGLGLRITTDCEIEWEVAHLCDGIEGNEGETMEANGHLFCAAPEMYDVLESILTGAINGEIGWQDLKNVKDVLAKARGENSQNNG
jgi:hypothetical protein